MIKGDQYVENEKLNKFTRIRKLQIRVASTIYEMEENPNEFTKTGARMEVPRSENNEKQVTDMVIVEESETPSSSKKSEVAKNNRKSQYRNKRKKRKLEQKRAEKVIGMLKHVNKDQEQSEFCNRIKDITLNN